MNPRFWRDKRVLLTGHTGFKGSWLALWLQQLGAEVVGYSLPAPEESLFQLTGVGAHMESVYADVRSSERLRAVSRRFRPEIVFHLAAQALVRRSYLEPIETYHVNVMGTVNLLEALRLCADCRVIVNVTSDKCYENREWPWAYRENDRLGGHDPYSSSKACAELVTAAYRRSFFGGRDGGSTAALATARAGNVIGGGDFSADRIVPDFMVAARTGVPLQVRNPCAVRPWQHVLEPLQGYLLLAETLWSNPAEHADSWNFGPTLDGIRSVQWVVDKLNEYYDRRVFWQVDQARQPHEARLLMLDSTKARMSLGWESRWPLEQALRAVATWYAAHQRGESLREVTLQQIAAYQATCDRDRRGDADEAPSPFTADGIVRSREPVSSAPRASSHRLP